MNEPLYIGRGQQDFSPIIANYQDFRVFGRALSNEEVRIVMNSYHPVDPAPENYDLKETNVEEFVIAKEGHVPFIILLILNSHILLFPYDERFLQEVWVSVSHRAHSRILQETSKDI